jgi:hypothetical protein
MFVVAVSVVLPIAHGDAGDAITPVRLGGSTDSITTLVFFAGSALAPVWSGGCIAGGVTVGAPGALAPGPAALAPGPGALAPGAAPGSPARRSSPATHPSPPVTVNNIAVAIPSLRSMIMSCAGDAVGSGV